MRADLAAAAEAARGFLPPEEGRALFAAAAGVPATVAGPFLEIGSYCGRSALFLGAAAEARGTVLFCVDHHHGSEENQPGWPWHEPDLVDPATGRLDTLPTFRRTVEAAGLGDTVVAVVGASTTVARHWTTPLAFLFVDGGHGSDPAHDDFEQWAPKVAPGGRLAVHDVFPDPADGGRPPYEVWCRALASGAFEEISVCGSLRVLERLDRALAVTRRP